VKVPNLRKLVAVIVIPAWIAIFGLAFQTFPALGLTGSLCLFVAGIIVIPAMALIPATLPRRAAALPFEATKLGPPSRPPDRGVDRPDDDL